MKKIVAAAAAGLMLAGAAFADVSFSYTGKAIMGDTTKSFTKATRNDCLALTLSNDVAGVKCDWDLNGGDKMELDEFYAWMDFALPVGALEITSGKWNGRNVNRVKTEAGDLDGKYYEVYKPGIAIGGEQVVDGANLTDGNYATVLAYTLSDVLPGKLMFKAGIVRIIAPGTDGKNEGKDNNNNVFYHPADKTDVRSHSSFAYEVSYAQDDLIKATVAIKNYSFTTTSYGVYVSPLMVPGLDSMVGFTYLTADDDGAMGIDARAKYAITEKTSVTGMLNYSTTMLDNSDADVSSLWTMLSVGYKAGDNIRYVATVNNQVKDMDAAAGTACKLSLSPACMIQASEKCNVTVGFDMSWDNVKPFAGTGTVTLPIYVSFSL